jgi:hypothetical protein
MYPVQEQGERSQPVQAAEPVVLTDAMIRSLKDASPWLRFLGILTFIGCGFLGLTGLIVAVVSLFVGDIIEEIGGIGGALLGLFYIAMGVLLIFPGRFTYNFGARIRNFLLSKSGDELALALKNNSSLWKFYGILSIVYLALIPVAIVVIVIAVAINY